MDLGGGHYLSGTIDLSGMYFKGVWDLSGILRGGIFFYEARYGFFRILRGDI